MDAIRRASTLNVQPTSPLHGRYRLPPHLGGTTQEPFSDYVPNLGQNRSHRLLIVPLRIVELCGGLASGLEALLRAGYAISSNAWVDTDPDAHTVVSHRIASLRHQFPHLLPPESIQEWESQLLMDVNTITQSSSTIRSERELTSSLRAHRCSCLTSLVPIEITPHRVRT